MKKKIILDNKEIFIAIEEYLSKRNDKLPDNASLIVGLRKEQPDNLFSEKYIPYIEVEYNE